MQSKITVVEESTQPRFSPPDAGMTCEACAYFKPYCGTCHGQCRRHAPVERDYSAKPVWPTVYETEWCGDYARRISMNGKAKA